MADDAAFIWDQPSPVRRRAAETPSEPPDVEGRISLREAERRFGVRVATLRTWARKGTIDGIRRLGDRGEWLVLPESVAHHLSRHKPSVSTPSRRSGPSDDGSSMLVPRDAWDKLMDQLGNLHEAGLNLAEARERAAKAETEASFLRERLAEIREERDALRDRPEPSGERPRRRWWPFASAD